MKDVTLLSSWPKLKTLGYTETRIKPKGFGTPVIGAKKGSIVIQPYLNGQKYKITEGEKSYFCSTRSLYKVLSEVS